MRVSERSENDFSQPEKSTENGRIQAFNGTFQDECPNTNWFTTLGEVRQLIEPCLSENNETRPHVALGERTRREFTFQFGVNCNLEGWQTQKSPS